MVILTTTTDDYNNDIITNVKTGETNGTRWAFGVKNAGKGTDKIRVWINNAEEVAKSKASAAKINTITKVKLVNQKIEDETGTKWFKHFECYANVTPIQLKTERIVISDEENEDQVVPMISEEDIPF